MRQGVAGHVLGAGQQADEHILGRNLKPVSHWKDIMPS